ncbi:MAG: heme-binding domain-containing protein [Candidatus Riflebacteria bacterium]|nr:heme-binding domain-containing protein [Candidatus Riflebacteria bacterium]
MKKALLLCVVLAVLGLALPVSNLVLKPSGAGILPAAGADATLAKALAVFEKKCLYCHAAGVKMPLYASFPIAKDLIAKDVKEGLSELDLAAELNPGPGKPVGEAALAAIEHVADAGTMPPGRFVAMHWDTCFAAADKEALKAWVGDVREKHHATPGVAAGFKREVVQPLAAPTGLDPEKVAVGDTLFHDKRLSKDNSIACAGCHALDKGGTDQQQFAKGVGGAMGDINSPTVYNSGLFVRQFWDGRAATLEEQANGPVNNPIEMASNWPEVIGKLQQDPAIVGAMTKLYPKGLVSESITDAIATFERSLVTIDSRFDSYLKGKADAISADEKEGYALFKSVGCAACHPGKALGGLTFEKMGRRRDYFAEKGGPKKPDLGRFNATQKEEDRFRFKVPTLRNVSATFPYFHDGTCKELSEAVRKMAYYQLDRMLTVDQTGKIVAFLNSLTGEYKGQPLVR